MKTKIPNIQDCISLYCKCKEAQFGVIYSVEKYHTGDASTNGILVYNKVHGIYRPEGPWDLLKKTMKYPKVIYKFSPVKECLDDACRKNGYIPITVFTTIKWLRQFYKNYFALEDRK